MYLHDCSLGRDRWFDLQRETAEEDCTHEREDLLCEGEDGNEERARLHPNDQEDENDRHYSARKIGNEQHDQLLQEHADNEARGLHLVRGEGGRGKSLGES